MPTGRWCTAWAKNVGLEVGLGHRDPWGSRTGGRPTCCPAYARTQRLPRAAGCLVTMLVLARLGNCRWSVNAGRRYREWFCPVLFCRGRLQTPVGRVLDFSDELPRRGSGPPAGIGLCEFTGCARVGSFRPSQGPGPRAFASPSAGLNLLAATDRDRLAVVHRPARIRPTGKGWGPGFTSPDPQSSTELLTMSMANHQAHPSLHPCAVPARLFTTRAPTTGR